MALRGAVAFCPLCAALFLPKRVPGSFAFWSMVVAPVIVIVGQFTISEHIDPLFVGIFGSLVILAVGALVQAQKNSGAGAYTKTTE